MYYRVSVLKKLYDLLMDFLIILLIVAAVLVILWVLLLVMSGLILLSAVAKLKDEWLISARELDKKN